MSRIKTTSVIKRKEQEVDGGPAKKQRINPEIKDTKGQAKDGASQETHSKAGASQEKKADPDTASSSAVPAAAAPAAPSALPSLIAKLADVTEKLKEQVKVVNTHYALQSDLADQVRKT